MKRTGCENSRAPEQPVLTSAGRKGVRAAPVVLISTITHGVFVALVADWTSPPAKRPAPAPAVTRRAQPDATPIEIAFLDEPAEAASAAAPARTRGYGHGRTAIRTSSTSSASSSTTSTSESGSGAGSGSGSGLMKMRGPDLALDAGTAERIAAGGATLAPRDELKKSGKLQSTPGGGAVTYDRVTTMTVEPDGTAHLDDIPDIDPKFHLPIPKVWEVENMRKELGHQLTEWFKDPEAGKRFGPSSELPRHLQAAPGACDSWGSTMCDDPLAPKIEQLVRERKKVLGGFFGGAADITAYLHRKFVGDPYASRKLKLLDDTREERVAMGMAYRAEQAARSAELMQRNVETLWVREPHAVARRAALFELWDECTEDEAGLRARAIVIGWIRAKLPAGSADAYTRDELDALQTRRTSSAPFQPYTD